MLPKIWVIPILLPLVFCSKKDDEVTASQSLASLFKEKCEGLPFRSYFIAESMTCYISYDSKSECSDIKVTYGKGKRGIPSRDLKKLKSVGITEDAKSQICGFTIQGECDSGEHIEDWCFNVQRKKRSFHDAAEFCEKKGETLPVLHDDFDVQRILHLPLKEDLGTFWIGASTIDNEWQFHDSTVPDFYRIIPESRFNKNALAMLFQGVSKNNSYEGYTDVSGINKKYPFVCAKRINDDYRIPIKINKFRKPITTTTIPPTTTNPKIQNPKEWITDSTKGHKLHRSVNINKVLHHYSLDPTKKPGDFYEEASPGYVVTEARYEEIKRTCPELVKVGIWRSGTMSYIGNIPPAKFVQHDESFYCAPRQFYCGANFELRRLDKKGGGDIFYPSTDDEAIMHMLAHNVQMTQYQSSWFLEAPCWVWQDYVDTNTTMIKAAGGMIWHGYDWPNQVSIYSLDIYELVELRYRPAASGPGFVVQEEFYESYMKEKCPELVPMRVWHGTYYTSEYNTWFGPEGELPPPELRSYVYRENRKFYCAPRPGYCGADFLLRRMVRMQSYGSFNPRWWHPPSDEAETFWLDYWKTVQNVCYIWKRWKGKIEWD